MKVEARTYYTGETVLEAARRRIAWLFDEFPNIVVPVSGGKDSTVALQLTLEEAERRGRTPVKVMFVDQEAEWQAVADWMARLYDDPRVDFDWLQMPIQLFNATSHENPWLYCWAEGAEWIREKHPRSLKTNVFGTTEFKGVFGAYLQHFFPKQPAALIGGMRAEESPHRRLQLTQVHTYKGETWGKYPNKARPHYTFYPIYDWAWTDVWKAIHEFGWDYCKVYDYQFQYGVPISDMRVSNLHHATAVHALHYLQEVEPDTWLKVQKRLRGINTTGQMKREMEYVDNLPWMFETWVEYRDFLLDKLVTDPDIKSKFKTEFARNDQKYSVFNQKAQDVLHRVSVSEILHNDYYMLKIRNLCANPRQPFMSLDRYLRGHQLTQKHVEQLRHAGFDVTQESIKDEPNAPENA